MQCRTKASTAPPDKRRLVPSTLEVPTAARPSNWSYNPLVAPERTVIETCARHTCTSETLRARTMNHRRSTKTSSRCPEWPRGSRDATPRRAHPPFSSTYISALCAAVNARTNVGSAAAPAHDPMGPRDSRRRQEITYSRSTGPLYAELELGRPLVPL